MTYKVIVKQPIKGGKDDDFLDLCKVAIPKNKELDSCSQIDLSLDEDHPNLAFMMQDWESSQDHKDLCLWS